MILKPAQAQGIYNAMAALHNIGTTYLFNVEYSTYSVKYEISTGFTVKGGDDGFEVEHYPNHVAFATAYGLQ